MAKAKKAAAKKAAPVKPERTRSRKVLDLAEVGRRFQIEREGEVITWDAPPAPYKDDQNLRAAFIGGMKARADQVNQGTEAAGPPERFSEGSKIQQAFEDGYNEAARQDGRNLKPKALTGSKSPKPTGRRR